MKSLLQVFASRRMAAALFLGFSSGIPLGLTGTTLQAWMTTEHVDLTVIGIFSLVGLPYTLKFLWAPLMDRYVPPFLGRRRGWILVCQVALILSISLMAFSQPVRAPGVLAVVALLVAFFSSSQDIVVDAYRTEALLPEELGAGAGVYILGYRVAMLVSGALALILSDHMPWRSVYLLMAAMMGVGVVTTLWAPEPQVKVLPPKNLKDAVILPLFEFFKRKGSFEILTFIVVYKLDVVVATSMMTPFFLQIGFSRTDIGAVSKLFGWVATIVGTLMGGAIMTRIGMYRSLWIFGIFQGISNLLFIIQAHVGHHYGVLVSTIALENLSSGMGTAAYTAFLMSLCDRRFTATQYALLTSLMAVTRVVAGAPTGWMAKNLGWENYFIVSTLLMIPGLLFLFRFKRWSRPMAESV